MPARPHIFLPPSAHLARAALALLSLVGLAGCRHHSFPSYPEGYREFAYISDGASDTVAVLDLVYLRQDRILSVGHNPTGLAVNPVRPEVYAVNTGSDSVTVIDATRNQVAGTIRVHRTPFFIDVSPDGHRAYVADSGSNAVSVLDLDRREEIATVAAGEGPGLARITADGSTVVVSNRTAGSVSVYTVDPSRTHPLQFRDAFPGCPGATDIALQADSAGGGKAFVACSGGHQVMAVRLAAPAASWRGTQDRSLQHDAFLTLLDVGETPTSLSLKPDGGEVFSTNFGSNSISEISTFTNEVTGTYTMGAHPSRGVISHDDSSLWVTNFAAESAILYSIVDGRLVTGVRTGLNPDALAFSADEHLLLVANSGSGDVTAIRTTDRTGQPAVFTMFPAGKHPNDIVVKSFTEPRSSR